jgi:hypothetical protein
VKKVGKNGAGRMESVGKVRSIMGEGWKRTLIGCLDVASTHDPSTRSIFFQSRRSYRTAEGRVEAKRRQRPGPPPATTNCLLAEPGGGPWANCAWVEVSRGRFVGGRIVKAPCD